MSDLVGNPEDRFSRVEAHIITDKTQNTMFLGSDFHLYRPLLYLHSVKLTGRKLDYYIKPKFVR